MSARIFPLALVAVTACVTPDEYRAQAPTSEAPTAKTETTAVVQTYTPLVHAKTPPGALGVRWSVGVGKTNHRTTMALAGGHVVIGTHGASHDAIDAPDDGVYVVDAKRGAIERVIRTPGAGRRDVGGVAMDGDRVFFAAENGLVVAASIDGRILWTRAVARPVLAAPTLADANADGKLDVIVGDGAGRIDALDGRSGAPLWTRETGTDSLVGGYEAGIAVGDVDGDGTEELIAASTTGAVGAFHVATGEPIWLQDAGAPVRATPILADLDGDKRLEALVAWADGTVRILDGKTGREMWGAHVERDDGRPVTLLGAPIPLLGPRVGAIAAPAVREPANGGLYVIAERMRSFSSPDGRVSATPVVTRLAPDGELDAIYGNYEGNLIAVDAIGGRAVLATLGGAIEASAMIADVDGDGAYEILVASNDGRLTCLSTGSTIAPTIPRFRGDSPHNTGLIAPQNMGWTFARNRDLHLTTMH